jgi:hypothetical protein
MKSKLLLKTRLNKELKPVFKARLVACGYSQRKGLDYQDTFSPTTTTISFHILITIIILNDLHMVSLDIANAFLEGDTDFNNYMFLPEDLTNFLTDNSGEKIRVKLGKSLYGIKQAAKVFNDKLNIHLMSIGFERLHNDVCLYIYDFNKLHKNKINDEKDSLGSSLSYDENEIYYLIIHVDDIIICGKEKFNIEMLLTQIQKGFKRITRSDDVIKYLGIKLNKMKNHYVLDQKFYIDKTLNDTFESITIKDSYIPMTTAINF